MSAPKCPAGMPGDTYWAVQHTGGCSGKMHGYTLKAHRVLAERMVEKSCTDPACRVVKVRVEVLQ